MKKASRILVFTLLLLTATVVSFLSCDTIDLIQARGMSPQKTYDVNEYLSGNYKNYIAGEKAATYFPAPEELGEYEIIAFYHADNSERRKTGYEVSDLFVLDVRYSEKQYFEEKLYELFLSCVENEKNASRKLYMQNQEWARDRIENSEKVEVRNFHIITSSDASNIPDARDEFYFQFDVEHYVVRYVFAFSVGKIQIFTFGNPEYHDLEYPPTKSE